MSKTIKKIAIYGKGGVGKSTIASNISAALGETGYKVLQFGCDPKGDSTNTLRSGNYIPTVLDLLREGKNANAYNALFQGFNGVYCVEAGGPTPGVGCAGRGIIAAVELFKQQNIFNELELDYVIFDVLGDVVCGGFAMPIRDGIAEHVFTISSADFMSIYATNNLMKGINKYSQVGGALFGGIIANSINTPYQQSIIEDFAIKTNTQVIEHIPRSITVTQSELSGCTTIESQPNSEQAELFRKLSRKISDHTKSKVPTPFNTDELHRWSALWAKQLLKEQENES